MSPKDAAIEDEHVELRELRRQGNAYFRAGQYQHAIQVYEVGCQQAKRRGAVRARMRFLNNLAGAYFQLFQYRQAAKIYLEARELAASQGDRELFGAIAFNLSSLYYQMGEIGAAAEIAKQGLAQLGGTATKFKAKLLIQSALIQARQQCWTEAATGLQAAIETATQDLDTTTEAQAWNELGSFLLGRGQLDGAEFALLQAYRLRKLTRDDRLHFSYESLGKLRVRRGDLISALALFDRAIESGRRLSPAAVWAAYYERGRVKAAQGHLMPAFNDFAAALRCVRRWRQEVLPADAFRVSTEIELHHVYSAFIETGSRLYWQTGRTHFLQAVFAAAEESRAASLRALWAGSDPTKGLPAPYWQTLSDLFRLETAAAQHQRDGEELRRLRLKVAEMEARAGLDYVVGAEDEQATGGQLLARVKRALTADQVFFGFHLGETESCLWAVTRDQSTLVRLPARSLLDEGVTRCLKALRENAPQAADGARQLYDQLFGRLKPPLLNKSHWVIAAEGALFDLPFAALVRGRNAHSGRPVYVVEDHTIQMVPGAWALFRSGASIRNGPLVGIGDPVYNRADPRTRSMERGTDERGRPLFKPHSPGGALELARLAGSARELESCAAIWRSHGAQPVLLRGPAATKANLVSALKSAPSVLHLAAHVLFPAEGSGPGRIALTLKADGELDLLSASEVAKLRAKLGLVILNGCSSGQGQAPPGAGLMGLTRAWLAAGARGVIATRWSVDDLYAGELFRAFYDRLPWHMGAPAPDSFARALQLAQVAELRAGGVRANPALWASYFCVERN